MKEFLKVRETYGSGDAESLTKSQVACLQRACDEFRKSLEANCNNYALYRCTLTADNDVIYAVLSGSDEKGNLQQLQMGYDMNTSDVYTRKISLKKEAVVGKNLYGLVEKLIQIVPFSVGMLDFPISGEFKEGSIMNYTKEKGTALIIIEDSLDSSYFLD